MCSAARRSFSSVLLGLTLTLVAACGGGKAPPGETKTSASTESSPSVDGLVALLSAFEAGPPTREQLEAASESPSSALIELSKDGSRPESVRQGAIRALGTLGTPQTLEALERLLVSPGSPQDTRAAIQGAAHHLDRPSLLAEVVARLRNPEPRVARAAVLALANHPPSRPTLEELAASELHPAVRTALNDALGIGDPEPSVPSASPLPRSPSSGGR